MHNETLLSVPGFYLVILYQFVAKYRADEYPLSFKMQWMKYKLRYYKHVHKWKRNIT